ncbi:hypothetical protein [Nitrospirillum viridazoti]|nr:hypothetical protein [Nitrospirillum amazonense]TWB33060.1 hypothetical protein FBZ91_115122 [Nitrospirillum amazonense]
MTHRLRRRLRRHTVALRFLSPMGWGAIVTLIAPAAIILLEKLP